MQKIGDALLQCGNNHYAKFEFKGMKTAGATDYTNQTPPKHFRWKKCLQLNTTQKTRKYNVFIKCAQNRRCISAMCEQSFLQSLNIKE